MVSADELAQYLTIEQAARVLDVPESRFRASWRQSGIVEWATRKGLIQIRRQDVVRAAVLVSLQRVLGEQSPLAVELAKSLTLEQLDTVLDAEQPVLDGTASGRPLVIQLDREYLARVRERLAEVPV